MSELEVLIKRLEAAEAGSRELDGQIWCEVYGSTFNRVQHGSTDELYYLKDGAANRLTGFPHYTTSLDAKLPWENIIEVRLKIVGPNKDTWRARHHEPGSLICGPECHAYGKTEALARRIAALKAHSSTGKPR